MRESSKPSEPSAESAECAESAATLSADATEYGAAAADAAKGDELSDANDEESKMPDGASQLQRDDFTPGRDRDSDEKSENDGIDATELPSTGSQHR